MKILGIDLETSPNTGHVWGLFKQTISLSQLMESSYTMCFAAKWFGDTEVTFKSVFHNTKEEMLNYAWMLLDEADVVVHYNGTKFDIPTINKEFLLAGMKPPSTFKQVDLLQTTKKRFRFPSNKLDYVAKALGLTGKVSHEGHELWVKCMNEDPEAWERMKEYNVQDVVLLEEVYERLLPWIQSHPNHGLYASSSNNIVCPNCGSNRVRKKGFYYTAVSKFQRYKCHECGANSRGRKNLADIANVVQGVI